MTATPDPRAIENYNKVVEFMKPTIVEVALAMKKHGFRFDQATGVIHNAIHCDLFPYIQREVFSDK